MNRRIAGMLLALVAIGCGGNGAPKFSGPPSSTAAAFGACAFCHPDQAGAMLPTGADLKCEICHADRMRGTVGPGHRAIPGPETVPSFVGSAHALGEQAPFGSCGFCHNQFATNMVTTSADLKCQVCHADRQPGTFGPAHHALPSATLVPSFAGPAHSLGDQAAFGACAFCHNQTAINISDSGTRDLHCETCHQDALSDVFGSAHRSLPGPELVPSFVGPSHRLGAESHYGSCGFCHNELTVHALASTGHGELSLDCAHCHAEQPEPFGPMHQRVPRCAECHGMQKTHGDPAVGTQSECGTCHEPHGSTNLFLVRELIRTPNGATRPVTLDSLLGLADGSFASVSAPGTGLCETCHTTTRYFRGDGSGLPHFPYACFTCHPHTRGFPAR